MGKRKGFCFFFSSGLDLLALPLDIILKEVHIIRSDKIRTKIDFKRLIVFKGV
jgi:hypothetical protein